MMDSQAFWGSVICFLAIVFMGCAAEIHDRLVLSNQVARDTAEARRIEESAKRPEVPQDIQELANMEPVQVTVSPEDFQFLTDLLKEPPRDLPWIREVPEKLELDF